MRLVFVICLFNSWLFGQTDKVYTSLEEVVNAPKDSVFHIDFSHQKLEEYPQGINDLPNLKTLNLSKNQIVDLPLDLNYPRLIELDMSKNKLEKFPESVCQFSSLQTIKLHKNDIDSIPECIGNLRFLKKLDLWFNPIRHIDDAMMNCRNLRVVDLRGVTFPNAFQEEWRKKMPWVKFEFDLGCDCNY